ncbi:Nuclear transcription factor Y subunit C-2 [Heracleum sosnowskyi]|uniref:Nuclear transcription factor Y subunit C-2 n=1 Tax=Heracleum sosnowskyi TaxID=360622 RepID=A0AAD8IXS5_9APIA|nr:Nuclear transcription factor Y subunit C-2 [Heracleum sosnowskyi]
MDESPKDPRQKSVGDTGKRAISSGAPAVATSTGVPVSAQLLLQSFWDKQMEEAEKAEKPILPVPRIRRIMKANKDVKRVSSDAPVLVAKACEMFISDLTLRAWKHTEENKRKLLQTKNIAAAISETEDFNFLANTVPSLPIQQGDTTTTMNHTQVDSSAELLQRQCVTQQHHVGPSGTTFDRQHQIRQRIYRPYIFWRLPQQQNQKKHHHDN